MRTKFIFFICIVMPLFVMVACNSDNNDSPDKETPEIEIPVEKNVVKETAKYVSSTYMGENNSNGNFVFTFYSAELDENSNPAPNSSGLHIELYSNAVPESDLLIANIESGRYVVGKEADSFVVLAGDSGDAGSYYFTTDASGTITNKYPILDGEIYFVIRDDFSAVFLSDLKFDESDNKWISFEYNGSVFIEPVYDLIYSEQEGWYWGDDEYEFPGIGEYMVTFYEGERDGNGLIEGHHIAFSYYSEMAPKSWEAQIPEGYYVSSTDYLQNSILVATPEIMNDPDAYIFIWRYALLQTIFDDVETLYFVTEGTSKVTRQGDDFILQLNFLLDDGTRHIAKYTGKVKQGDEYTRTTLTADRSIGNLDYGYLEFETPSYFTTGVNKWNIRLYNNDITVHPDYYWGIEKDGSGEYVVITVFTDSSYTTDIPVGKYFISEEETPFHASTGEGGWGITFGSWYYEINENEAPAVSGEVEILKDGEEYTITINFVDDRDNNISGTYTGPLTYWDSYNEKTDMPQYDSKNVPLNSYDYTRTLRAINSMNAYYGR